MSVSGTITRKSLVPVGVRCKVEVGEALCTAGRAG